MNESPNLKAAQDLHHKFELYLVALAFTTAAFAIQTGKFSGNELGDMAEILSWLLLVVSGALGLWRLEYIPVAYRVHDYIQDNNKYIEYYENEEGQPENVVELKRQVAEKESQLKDIESKNQSKYCWQKRFFVLGFGCLLVARLVAQMEFEYR